MAEEMRFAIPNTLKYFCQSEAIAFYLQKYIAYRKRRIYVGGKSFTDLVTQVEKFKQEKYLLPSSDKLKPSIPKILDDLKIDWNRAVLFRTVASDLSNLKEVSYDILVFFSPSGIESLFKNFPDFEQNNIKIAVFGNSTTKAAIAAGLKCDIEVPTPESPSMTMALEKYIVEANKG
jgi:uroporphyrinogen-III synthase